ncbi:MAG TPA: hypothetical protein VK044_08000 [Virgibacillus sp.]|nr:hypothetical protein [Virgibacillus sp.]
MNKILDILLWSTVGLTVVIFFAIIMIGHATNYSFLKSLADEQVVLTSTQYVVSKFL